MSLALHALCQEEALTPRLVPHHIAGFAVMYGFFLAFGELGPGSA